METIKMSSKGQVVIPQNVRDQINADEGTLFAVVNTKDTVILKKLQTPSKESLLKELGRIAKEGKRRLKKQGIRESDIPKIIQRRRV